MQASDQTEEDNTFPAEINSVAAFFRSVERLSGSSFTLTLLLLNFAVLFVRPQDWIPGLGPVLEAIHFPLLLSLVAFFLWLPRMQSTWYPITKTMLTLIIVGALLIVVGKYINDSFIINDGWAFAKWRDLAQQYFGYFFPLVVFVISGSELRRLLKAFLMMGSFLGVYAVTHSGRGPGGFVGDENDLALTLLLFFPLAIFLLAQKPLVMPRFWLLFCSLSSLAGIVASGSRGGFVGLILVLGYLFIRSNSRLILGVLLFCSIGIATLFAPQDYIDEMKTITDVSSGTAKSRTDLWNIAFRMWKDPHNILTGVGMGNFRWRVADYESDEDILTLGRSRASRQVHSLYFELLTELGVVGVLIFGAILFLSIGGNRRSKKELYAALKRLHLIQQALVRTRTPEVADSIDKKLGVIRLAGNELQSLSNLFLAIGASWIAVLAAGAFISVFYYPPIWFLATLSCITQNYTKRVIANSSAALASLDTADDEQAV